MRSRTILCTFLGAVAGAAGMLAATTRAAPPPRPVLTAAAEYRWTEALGAGTPKVAVLWGDPAKDGDTGFLIRFPPGATSPPHLHSSDYWAVTVSGTMRHWTVGESEADAKALPAGSYQMMPGMLPHFSKCDPGADCIVLVHMNARFDAKLLPERK